MNLEALLRERILLLDGAMGTMIQRARLAEEDYRGARFRDWARELRGNNDLLSLTQPHLVRDIHTQYLAAGADIIETNTFNSTSVAMADYGMETLARELNRASARLATEAAREWQARTGQARFVAGVLGPTNKTASLSPDVNDPGYRAISFDELVGAYSEALGGLIEGGIDLVLVETIFDTLNAKAALFALEQTFAARGARLPVIISGTITDASGRTLSGQTTEAFYNSVRHSRPLRRAARPAIGALACDPRRRLVDRAYLALHAVVGLRDPRRVERIRLDEIGAGFEIRVVDRRDRLRLRQRQQVVVAGEIARMIVEAATKRGRAGVRRVQRSALSRAMRAAASLFARTSLSMP